LYYSSLLLAVLSDTSLAINTLRAGGFITVFLGKATYQSEVANLSGTLPASWFLFASAAMFGLSIAYKSHSIIYYITYVMFALPNIFVMIVLGQRMDLATVFICIFASFRFYRPLRRVAGH